MPINDEAAPGLGVLIEGVQALTGSVQDLTARSRRNRLLIVVTGIGLTLDLALSVLFFAQHVAQVHTNQRIVCQNNLRSANAALADKDRENVDQFFASVVKVQTASQFKAAYRHYLTVRNADEAERARLGFGNSSTCG